MSAAVTVDVDQTDVDQTDVDQTDADEAGRGSPGRPRPHPATAVTGHDRHAGHLAGP